MTYYFIEHMADEAFVAEGSTLESVFEESAKAVFSLMFDIKNCQRDKEIRAFCTAKDLEGLLVEWINNLLALKDIHDLVFCEFKVEIVELDGVFNLNGRAYGETLDIKRHVTGSEVKAATYSKVKVEKEGDIFRAQLLLDV